MAIQNNFPNIRPTLNLNFALSKRVDPRITFVRSTTATYFDQDGILQTAAANQGRITFDPSTLDCQGLLIEEQRTNSIRNNTMVGAVAGTPGTVPTNWDITVSGSGITQQIVGTGVEDGITYIDVKFSGTGSGTAVPQIRPETTTQIVAAAGQSWASSWYLRIVGGSTTGCTGTFQQVWQERDAAGAALNTVTVGIADPTSAALKTQRSILTRTLTDAGTARLTNRIQWTFTNGVAVDITLRIGLPQLELGAFATSVIPTTTTALTRNADVASMTGTNFSSWYNAVEGTLFSESINLPGQSAVVFPRIANINDGTTNNVITTVWRSDTSRLYGAVTVSGVNVAEVGVVGVTQTNANKIALGYATDNFASSVNGGAVNTDTSGAIPSVNRLGIGRQASAADFINGYIRRIAYYPVRVTDAQLQALTG
jgi:hypothetical protein